MGSEAVTWEFPKIGVPYFGVLIIRILLFRVLYLGPLFSETPTFPETVQSHCVRLWSLVLRPVKSLNTTRVYTPHMQIPEVTRGALGFRP